MNFGLDLNMHVGLEQKLSPQMIQSLKLLQMNSLELDMVVKQELEANPMLEAVEAVEDVAEEPENGSEKEDGEGEAAPEQPAEEAQAQAEEPKEEELVIPEGPEKSNEIDWESYLEDGFDLGSKHAEEERENPDERFEKVPVYNKSLQDHLLAQLQDRHVDKDLLPLVEYLIHSLDEGGYLSAGAEPEPEPEESLGSGTPSDRDGSAGGAPDGPRARVPEAPAAVASKHPAPKPREAADIAAGLREIQEILEGRLALVDASLKVREAFHVLHGLDPAGIGARNLRECLLLQIRRHPNFSPLARRIVEGEFELLEKLKISALARKLEVSPEQVQAALKEIGTLEPRPGRLVAQGAANTVIPDLIVEDVDGELVLMLNDRSLPSLRISRAYANLLKKGSKATTEEKKFVREKLNSATWLIRAIEQRKSTMLKVMHAIIESQPDFFRKGPTHLRPLILQDIADKIGMHISTVSRVTNGKYVQTPHGIFELKYFFSAGVMQSDGSEVSSVATKDEIKKLIEAEDARNPLSDQKIVEILKSKGLDVARRTVAKYRDQLEILPARLRKQY